MSTLLIKNGTLVLEEEVIFADILIENEKIIKIGKLSNEVADKTIDANNKIVIPGGIDPHTHFDLPAGEFSASDSFSSGSKAALFGGTTTIIDFANQKKGHSLKEAVDLWKNLSHEKTYCDYAFHISVTDVNEETLNEVKEYFYKGYTSFKTFMAYPSMKISDHDLEHLMIEVKKLGGIVTLHAEIGNMIEDETNKLISQKKLAPSSHPLSHPEEAEHIAVKNFMKLIEKTGCMGYVVHTSSSDSVINSSLPLWFETCPQYLFLDDSVYQEDFEKSSRYVMSPPLRTKGSGKKLLNLLKEGKIHTLATDHCPFLMSQRKRGLNDFTKIPNGAPGVEDRMELFFNEAVVNQKMPLNHFVEIASTNASKLFGLYPQKGVLKVGSDADIVIINPNKEWVRTSKTHHMNCDYNIYEGMSGKGKCETVILRGEIAIHDEQFLLKKPMGKELTRNAPKALS